MLFQRLRNRFSKERDYLGGTSLDQRYLLVSVFLYALALPMITTFSNTYLWRQSQDPVVLAVFNIGYLSGLSLGFMINGLFLRRFSPQKLCALGCVLQGVVPMVLVFLGAQADTYAIALGLCLGVSAGFYWGNRNLVTSRVSQGPGRYKYLTFENIVQIFSAVLAPFLVGWFLVLGEQTGVYSVQTAYQIAAIVAFFLLVLSGRSIAGVQEVFPSVKVLLVKQASRVWDRMRVLDFFNGCASGLEAALLFFALLTFLDQENAIGSLLSFTAVLAALGMYILGKRAKHRDHAAILGLWASVTLVGKIAFAVLYSTVGAIILQLVEGLMKSFRWASMSAVMYEAVEHEQPDTQDSQRYAYIMDREFVLNLGRVSALTVVVVVYQLHPTELIRYGLLSVVVFQILMISLTRIVTRETQHVDKIPVARVSV